MKISDVLEIKGIIPDLKVRDKTSIINQMGRFLASLYNLKNEDLIIQKILDRESQVSTGIGYGIAIPHARLDSIDSVHMIAARCVPGVDFGAIDEQPVNIIFMMISPLDSPARFTTLLSKLSKIMSYEEIRSSLIDSTDSDGFYKVVIDGENRYAP